MTQKIALITGIAGQDGSYLAELLLEKGYRVIGLIKNRHIDRYSNIRHLKNKIEHFFGDLSDQAAIYDIIKETEPHEVYNLASQSYPGESWTSALKTVRTNGLGAHHLFDTIRQLNPSCKIYQASSSEMYGEVIQTPQNEDVPFKPVNPYAAAKLYAHNIANIYRKSYQMFISCGILFNHESERRGMHFITQKVSYAAACLKLGIQNSVLLNENGDPIVKHGKLMLGNLDAQRDWGYARDYVEAMWLMLQHNQADDFVIGTGQIRTIRQLCEAAFTYVNLNWEDYIQVDKRFIRPTDTGPTVADTTKAKKILGWEAKTTFNTLIKLMVDNHLKNLDE